jgi:hypothetical protein
MSALETPRPASAPAGGLFPARRHAVTAVLRCARRLGLVAVPAALALAYLAVLVVRYPQLLAWQNGDSDIVSNFTLTDAIARGHYGTVWLSTQASALELGWGLLTHGLPFHRTVWEFSAPGLSLVTAGLLAGIVGRLAGRRAALVALVLVLAVSPTALMSFTAASFHNTAPLGAVALDGYLLWLTGGHRGPAALALATCASAALLGALIATDQLLLVVGVVPFVLVGGLTALRRRDVRLILAVVAPIAGGGVIAHLIDGLLSAHRIFSTAPPLRFGGPVVRRIGWLATGVLRLGNGLSVAPHSAWLTPLVIACAVTAAAGLAIVAGGATAILRRRRETSGVVVHGAFWGWSLIGCSAAYVLTDVALFPSDRYLVPIVIAAAAMLPVTLRDGRGLRLLCIGAAVTAAGSVAALAGQADRPVMLVGTDVPYAARLEHLITSHHLGRGYAGYWEAASLQWTTHDRLRVRPVFLYAGRARPMYLLRATAWYRPHRGPSYLILAPGDGFLPDRLPPGLPAPVHSWRIGTITLDAFSSDIARDLGPVPGQS